MNKSRMTIVCLILAVILMVGSLVVGCTIQNNTSTPISAKIGNPAVVKIIPTTKPTVEPTTTAKKKVEKSTEPPIEETIEETEPVTEETDASVEPTVKETPKKKQTTTSSDYVYSPSDFQFSGVIDWGGWTWTYYSQRVLPGEGLSIPGRHVDENGYVCDENDYICLASSSLSWGEIISTPFGKSGRVYDSGCASYILDVYVDW